ncbi:ferredoxin family protein [Candidatus Bathyarchaeota archaeon]|nr:ferredoxin family protein [Candidatus Bathyarchaeota archaeon]
MPKVKVDWVTCNGCGTCVDNCPTSVFELHDLPDYTDSKKSVPVRADDCILCMTCVTSCPTGAITVEE